jgi:phosphoribosylanthranilate isomerase
MIIKICGMRESTNIKEIAQLKPDWMGFIFYPKSKRYVGDRYDTDPILSLMPEIRTTGVFVNEDIDLLLSTATKYHLDLIQLHGNESPSYCQRVTDKGLKVIKALGIYQNFKWNALEPYLPVCDYFLFDTSTKEYGGSGQKFDWNILTGYRYNKPFLLSGGIKPEDAGMICSLSHPQFAGIDINSGFETEPGIKDPEKVKYFINEIRTSKKNK